MTISFILKRSKAGFSMDDSLNGATIYVRLRDGRLLDSTASTGETVNPLWWDAKREEIKANIVCDNKVKAELNEKLQDLKKFLYSKHKVDKEKGDGGASAAPVFIDEAPYEPPAYEEPPHTIYRTSSGYGWEDP